LVSLLHHRALGRDLDQLVVAVIDNRRPILSVMRAMLAAIGTGRIETHEHPDEALQAMARDVPDLVIASASMQPVTGSELIRTMRHKDYGLLSMVPAMVMSAHAKASQVEEALRAGAHQVLVLPTSASTLYRRLDWLLNDDRPFELDGEHYAVAGMEERFALSFPRPTYKRELVSAPLATVKSESAESAEPYTLRMRAAQH
jgi:two-component system chemotaxis response regulator CheY